MGLFSLFRAPSRLSGGSGALRGQRRHERGLTGGLQGQRAQSRQSRDAERAKWVDVIFARSQQLSEDGSWASDARVRVCVCV